MNKLLEFRKDVEDKFREEYVKEMGGFETLGEGAPAMDQAFYDDPADLVVQKYRLNDYLLVADWQGPAIEKYLGAFAEFMKKIKDSVAKAKSKMKDVKVFQKGPMPTFKVLLHEDDYNGEKKRGLMFAASFGMVGSPLK